MSGRAAKRKLGELVHEKVTLNGRRFDIDSVIDYVSTLVDSPRRTRMLDDLGALRDVVASDRAHVETVIETERQALFERLAAGKPEEKRADIDYQIRRVVANTERKYR